MINLLKRIPQLGCRWKLDNGKVVGVSRQPANLRSDVFER
jgi:hypothetical protein